MTSTERQLELFWASGTCGLVTLVALEQIGVPVIEHVLTKGWRRNPDYLAVNPKGRVPALLINGTALTETPAIIVHLARLYPEAQLLPADPEAEADAISVVCWFASALHPLGGRIRHPMGINDDPASFKRTTERAAEELRASFDLVERRLEDREWLCGDWSVADAYLLWLWSRSAGTTLAAKDYPRCAEHAQRCACWPSVERALARERAAATLRAA